jgi:hypothetical protein
MCVCVCVCVSACVLLRVDVGKYARLRLVLRAAARVGLKTRDWVLAKKDRRRRQKGQE